MKKPSWLYLLRADEVMKQRMGRRVFFGIALFFRVNPLFNIIYIMRSCCPCVLNFEHLCGFKIDQMEMPITIGTGCGKSI